jgi:hypothetical protein
MMLRGMRNGLLAMCCLIVPVSTADGFQGWGRSGSSKVDRTQSFHSGGATIQVDFAEGPLEFGDKPVMQWVEDAAKAVTNYYGRFPVPRARVLVIPVADRHGVLQGTTWGGRGGFPGFTRMRIGEHTTEQEFKDNWTMTHELVHMAFPDLPEEEHWMEEGLATYAEPIARLQVGQIDETTVWDEMIDGMPKGEPQEGDEGLNRTHTWGRTYWGGALFCLVADVEIRKETKNRKGLRDALRAIMAAGGTIDQDWALERAMSIGDQATGTHVLSRMYAEWSMKPVQVDLPALWKQLGVRSTGDSVVFDAKAPMAGVRQGIVER